MKRLHFRRPVLEELSATLAPAVRDEMAIPSYLHPNLLIQWLIARRMDVVLRLAAFRPGERLLDFGCGVGMLALQLPAGQVKIAGVDLDPAPARAFLDAHGRTDVTLHHADSWVDAIADGSIDCIIALEVLEHVDDVPAIASTFIRKLRPEGRLVVCGPTENTLYALGRKIAGFSGQYHHRTVYDFLRELETAGFRREKTKRIPLPWPFELFVAARYGEGK